MVDAAANREAGTAGCVATTRASAVSDSDEYRRPPTAQEAVLEELRRRITGGRIAADEQILQDDLAKQLGVSRAPVREALKTLVGEGLVAYEPHRGYFVRMLHYPDLEEIYRIRALLETEVARAAVVAQDPELAGKLDAEIVAMELADANSDLAQLQIHNRRFHFLILEAAGMPHFLEHLRSAWNQTDPYRALYYADEPNRRRVHEEHRQIVEALRSGDADSLITLLDAHRRHAIEGLAQPLDRLAREPKG